MAISFGAKLKIDENYGKNLPSDIDEKQIKKLAMQYKTFVNKSKACSILIPDDTIVLSSRKHRRGFSIDLDIYEKDSKTPFQTTHYISKGCEPNFNIHELMFLTYQYIAAKFNVKRKCSESPQKYVIRASRELLEEKELK